MNDAGKTVREIRKIRPSYRRIGRSAKAYRCIEIKMQLVLTGDQTEPPGYEGTLRLIDAVTDRTIKALAEEFLP
jgi:hypothetical protein